MFSSCKPHPTIVVPPLVRGGHRYNNVFVDRKGTYCPSFFILVE